VVVLGAAVGRCGSGSGTSEVTERHPTPCNRSTPSTHPPTPSHTPHPHAPRRYIHDYHVTWVKDGGKGGVHTAGASADGDGSLGAALGERVRQELPSDPITQVGGRGV